MKDNRVHAITIEYDGSGDSGTVENICFSPADSCDETAQALLPLPLLEAELPPEFQFKTVEDALDQLGWDIAYSSHPGFEINEGGYGWVTIGFNDEEEDPTSVVIEITHNERYIEVNSSTIRV